MSKQATETTKSETESHDIQTKAEDAAPTIKERAEDGTVFILAGGVLLLNAIRSRERRSHALVQGVPGAVLIGIGLKRYRSETEPATEETIDIQKTGTTETRAMSQQHRANPRGTEAEPEIDGKDTDNENIEFIEDQEERAEPNLESSEGDPRFDDEDEKTEVSLSQAAMADEPSEAAGPSPEQSQPTQTDDSEPEHSLEESPHIDKSSGGNESSTHDNDSSTEDGTSVEDDSDGSEK